MRGFEKVPGRRSIVGRMAPALLAGLIGLAGLALAGCSGYRHTRGNPVEDGHYQQTIYLRRDLSQVSIQTYVNRTQWVVGIHREDLYDGDHDGALETPGMDRVVVTDYMDVEDPPEKRIVRSGELREYNDLFKEIVAAAKAGREKFKIEDREYTFEFIDADGSDTASAGSAG